VSLPSFALTCLDNITAIVWQIERRQWQSVLYKNLSMSQSLSWHLIAYIKQCNMRLPKLVLECHHVSFVQERVMMPGDQEKHSASSRWSQSQVSAHQLHH